MIDAVKIGPNDLVLENSINLELILLIKEKLKLLTVNIAITTKNKARNIMI